MIIGGQVVELLTVEYPAVGINKPDLVMLQANADAFHMEIQSTKDSVMGMCMLEFYVYIKRQLKGGPIQWVLHVGKAAMNMPDGIEEGALQYKYKLIDIRQLDGQQLLESEWLADNLFAILCWVEEVKVAIKRIVEKMARLTGKNQQDALVKLLIVAELRDCQEVVKLEAQEKSITMDIEQKALLKEVFEEGEQKGIEKGEATLLGRLFEQRLGVLPDWAEAKLVGVTTASLERWGLQLQGAANLAEALT
jgi:hypothetical protein